VEVEEKAKKGKRRRVGKAPSGVYARPLRGQRVGGVIRKYVGGQKKKRKPLFQRYDGRDQKAKEFSPQIWAKGRRIRKWGNAMASKLGEGPSS